LRSCTSSRIANSSSARLASETVRQDANATFADWTARSTSSTEASCTSPVCRPVAVLSAQAGVDLLLLIGSESSSERVYDRLVVAAQQGRIPFASLRRSYDRIQALKGAYG